jgi:prophage regulatory protein
LEQEAVSGLKHHRASKAESEAGRQRSQRIAEDRQRARAAVGVAGIRRVLRIAEVEAVIGRPRSAIFAGVADGTFPRPIPLGERSRGWLEAEIAAWLEQRIAERDANKPRSPNL